MTACFGSRGRTDPGRGHDDETTRAFDHIGAGERNCARSAGERRDRRVPALLYSRRGQEERRISVSARPDRAGRGRKRRRIHLSRQREQGLSAPAGGGAEEIYPLDAPVPVFPGDNIWILERYF